MCYRFHVEPDFRLRPLLDLVRNRPLTGCLRRLGKPMPLSGDIRPTDAAAVFARSRRGDLDVFPMIWGFQIPERKAPVVNCRIETAAEKPLWRESWRQRRCAVPASWYYEWEHEDDGSGKQKTGTKYALRPVHAAVVWLAGLYRFEERQGMQIPVFSILTRTPSESVCMLHDRMPLILPEYCIEEWIAADSDPFHIASHALTEIRVVRADVPDLTETMMQL